MVSSGKKKSIIKQSAESGADSSQSTLVLRDRLWSGPSPSPVLGSVGKWRVSFHPTSSVGSGSDCSHPTPSPLKNTKQTPYHSSVNLCQNKSTYITDQTKSPITAVSIYVKTNMQYCSVNLYKHYPKSLLCQTMSKTNHTSLFSVNLCQKQITHHCCVNLCQNKSTLLSLVKLHQNKPLSLLCQFMSKQTSLHCTVSLH